MPTAATAATAAREKKALFTFGRFQPPTIGHKVLIEYIVKTAAEQEADPFIYVSSTQNKLTKKDRDMERLGTFASTKTNENPLSVDVKLEYLHKMYPDRASIFINTEKCGCKTLFSIIDRIKSQGYTSITMAAGSDRIPQYESLMNTYKTGVTVISAGERTKRMNETKPLKPEEMSGTDMRKAAVAGDIVAFTNGIKIGLITDEDAFTLLNLVRQGLGYNVLEKPKGGRRSRRAYQTRKQKVRFIEKKTRKYRLRLEERT